MQHLSLPFFSGHETPRCVSLENQWEEKSKSEKLSDSDIDSCSLGKATELQAFVGKLLKPVWGNRNENEKRKTWELPLLLPPHNTSLLPSTLCF